MASAHGIASARVLRPARLALLALWGLLALLPATRPLAATPATKPAAATAPVAPAASAPVARRAWPIVTGQWVHALAAFGTPKYGPDFKAFDYVNQDAPKGGTIRLSNPDRRSSFDKYNPYTTRGVAPAAMTMFVFEPLATFAMDEANTMYGLLAEAMYVDPDLRFMSFRLRPEARFSDGSPVTAADVVHSFKQLSGKGAAPFVSLKLVDIADAVALDERTVRFDFREPKLELVFTLGDLVVFSRQWGGGKPFDQIVTEWPIATGPYALGRAQMPSRIELKRRPDYWATQLPARRGHFNFDRLVYRMYKDNDVRREAFKAGEFELLREMTAGQYVRAHKGPKWDDGRIVKKVWQVQTGSMLQAFDFNLRKPKFQDIRVREAIALAFDFDAYNKYGTFRPADSIFNNTEFAAAGLPSPEELKLLEPYRAELPAAVFGPPYLMPNANSNPQRLRGNLKRAAALLADAGWKVGDDGWVRNAKGETLDIEFLEPVSVGRLPEFERNLLKLGIRYSERLVDFALYRRRLETFDFDLVIIVEGKFTQPDAADLDSLYGSAGADSQGSNNYRGVKSRVVDDLVQRIAKAATLDELRAASRALDRVIMWNHWQIPMLYTNTEPSSYWNRFGIPKVVPKYYQLDSMPDVHSLPWPIWTWWDKASEPAAATAR
jgi:peptide/nickel transport system substrate-binding protein/microcin C transport system substrate-binding protein